MWVFINNHFSSKLDIRLKNFCRRNYRRWNSEQPDTELQAIRATIKQLQQVHNIALINERFSAKRTSIDEVIFFAQIVFEKYLHIRNQHKNLSKTNYFFRYRKDFEFSPVFFEPEGDPNNIEKFFLLILLTNRESDWKLDADYKSLFKIRKNEVFIEKNLFCCRILLVDFFKLLASRNVLNIVLSIILIQPCANVLCQSKPYKKDYL